MRRANFVIQVDNTLTIDGERLARQQRTVTGKLGVLREYRRHSEFTPRGMRRRIKPAKAQRLRRPEGVRPRRRATLPARGGASPLWGR